MRIALVDDCPNDLSIMHQFLAEALDTDSVITEFHNGEDFLQHWSADTFDLIVLDILIFALYPFLDDLRFSRTKTGLLIVVLTFLQILFGLLACFSTGNISAVLSLISTLSYTFFTLLSSGNPQASFYSYCL